MSRSVPWRRAVSDACCWHQSQALESTLYILRQTGPTGFLLKEEGETKNVKVFLGDPHSCTCSVFKKERDLCKHICWLLLRKFRLSVNDPLTWQLGLVEREINEILRGRVTSEQHRVRQAQPSQKVVETYDGRNIVEQRDIADEDVCPICQEELLAKKLPVTYCKFGCGNSIHIKCMQVWAEHQQKSSADGTIKCPMCREDFGPIDLLKTEMKNAGCNKNPAPGIRMDRHIGMACAHCNVSPIEGKCYRCSVCPSYFMCQRCFNLPVHTNHGFQFRQKRNQRWKSALRSLGSSLPPALVNDLMNREISENDYDILLQLERNSEDREMSNLTEESLQTIPIERVRDGGPLLAPGSQCRVCLRGFTVGQFVRKLPCKHKFHKDCIDSWLLHSHPSCPIDGLLALPAASALSAPPPAPSDDDHHEASPLTSGHLILTSFGIPLAPSHTSASSTNNGSHHHRLVAPRALPNALSRINLELSGTSLSRASPSHESLQTDVITSSTPGHRLLQHTNQHRDRLSQQLRALDRPDVRGLQSDPLTPADLIHILQSSSAVTAARGQGRRLSAGSIASVQSDSVVATSAISRLVRGQTNQRHHQRADLRRRPHSNERAVPSIRDIRRECRDLFLGNNPLTQPAVTEDLVVHRPPLPQRLRPGILKPAYYKPLPPVNDLPVRRTFRLDGNTMQNNNSLDNNAPTQSQ
ncbi:unnamed protein product [Lymnaea stagnalis]|uniref:E3 ubiquitin-protein ligase ZSWIM2 n=1 Tax=Lymnaea stagnalis TaxID=6523 RepID=A0AAV2HK60_LYMST